MQSPWRELFDIPRDVAYLSAASYSPLPRVTVEAGCAAMGNKAQPWLLPAGFIEQQNEGLRERAARLINADASDVALVSSVGYGIATMAKVVPVPRGSRVLVLGDDHSSPVLEWHTRADAQGFRVETVAMPPDHDWTRAVLNAIARPDAPPLAIASISSVHWSDGAVLDMMSIATAVKRVGATLIVDATQGVGVTPVDVVALDPDALLFPTYKWLLGPYGRAFLYVAKRWQNGVPLEQTAHGRIDVRAENAHYLRDMAFTADARRYDMGERDHFVSMPMTAASLDLVTRVGPAAVAVHTHALTSRLADAIKDLPVTLTPERVRSPHILSLGFPQGMPANLGALLARQGVHAAVRLGRLRLAPHIYNDAADIDRAAKALHSVLS
jgi:selenocysteine lyase/cysteine desulfurase